MKNATTTTPECTHEIFDIPGGVPVRSWTVGVPFEEKAREQVRSVASLPFVCRWVVVMPDVHTRLGATVGSVIPTVGAVMPSAVGVDIGCGMMAVRTTLRAEDHARATAGIEYRKDADVIDETPAAYKSIDEVMHAQRDLVEVLHTLRQVVCVKG